MRRSWWEAAWVTGPRTAMTKRLSVRMATMATIHTTARPMDITALIGLSVAYSSAPVRGSTVGAMVIGAVVAIGAAEVGAVAAGAVEAGTAEAVRRLQDRVADVEDSVAATLMADPSTREAVAGSMVLVDSAAAPVDSTVVVGSTVVEVDSTVVVGSTVVEVDSTVVVAAGSMAVVEDMAVAEATAVDIAKT